MDFSSLFFICGPCVIESREFALETAHELKELFDALKMQFVYKSSFDKANRTSNKSFRGVGLEKGLCILEEIKNKYNLQVITDVHTIDQVNPVSQVVDIMQTPAFLCRQTDFIRAVAATGKPVNFKKGQFMSPWEMVHVIDKANDAAIKSGNNNPIFFACERGFSFGYGNLVVDMRSLSIMKEMTKSIVVFDATHSVQLPGALGNASGGERKFVALLARAAVATGAIGGVFFEAHPNPDSALCDGPNMLSFTELQIVIKQIMRIYQTI